MPRVESGAGHVFPALRFDGRQLAEAVCYGHLAGRLHWRHAVAALLGMVLVPLAGAVASAESGFRFSAPIEVVAPATFVELALTPDVYARSRQAELRDLRLVDAAGERVPFAFAPQPPGALAESRRAAQLYPLPPRPSASGVWESPVEVVVEGDRLRVTRRGRSGTAAKAGASVAPAAASGGWLFDLGARKPADPAPRALQVAWSGPAEFAATFSLETSPDLREWRSAGSGQLLALASTTGALTQPLIELPAEAPRFVRLVWADPATAPRLSGADVIGRASAAVATVPATELVLDPTPAPPAGADDPAAARALNFDLGAVLPLVEIELRFLSGTRVAPVRVQGRDAAGEPWRNLGQAVFYRFEQGKSVNASPALAMPASVRFVRVVADERAARLDPAQTRLAARAELARLVFVAQGAAPYRLLTGSPDAAAGALPPSTLIPRFDDERPRFGRARLGAWGEVATVAAQAEADARRARWRPWVLWSVLLVGVAALGAMVIRLVRSGPVPGRWAETPGASSEAAAPSRHGAGE